MSTATLLDKLTKCADRHVARQAEKICRPPRRSTS
ncbi:hypothetical protein CCACVL1_02691 [Corchorus capsularis]|uniref:Uncharacterized protein n=1 Tax=Corchorus capsularis TaxID=210143 RepID=A0A1R3K6W6_COCAP|nr:hypothetical protein CCACVL1_02691 [Corchorus capsularis]